MSSGIYAALSGARAQSHALDSTARNIANVSTTAYKAERISFKQSLTAAQSPDQRYVAVQAPAFDMSQGAIRHTGNSLDLALEGEGFFAIQTDDGERLTRDGAFRIDVEGQLVNSTGARVLDEDGEPMLVPTDAGYVEINDSGEVISDGISVGDLKIVNYAPESLMRVGANMYAAEGEPLEDAEPPMVVSEALEGSNFNAVRGVVDVIKVTRTFQALVKMMESYKETEGRAAKALGGPK
ncbi:MAG: flagellar basal-body rod protein FlgF [Myxococcales bacterium]|nr:flagellar basal-body rod protein FlgF [Myxococcales bacterium]